MAGIFSMFPAFGRQAVQPPKPPAPIGAPPSGANFPQVSAPALPAARPAAPTGYVPPSYLYSPMRMVNDDDMQGLMQANPNLYANVYYNGPQVAQMVAQDRAAGVPLGAQSAGASGGGGVTWDIPYGVDPVWYKQFTAEHEGKTPEDVYKRDGEYAIAHALSDKAWGDQFYRTYGRPPSEYDWKASYYQRQNTFYGG